MGNSMFFVDCSTSVELIDMKNTSSTSSTSIIGAIWKSGSSSGISRTAFFFAAALVLLTLFAHGEEWRNKSGGSARPVQRRVAVRTGILASRDRRVAHRAVRGQRPRDAAGNLVG